MCISHAHAMKKNTKTHSLKTVEPFSLCFTKDGTQVVFMSDKKECLKVCSTKPFGFKKDHDLYGSIIALANKTIVVSVDAYSIQIRKLDTCKLVCELKKMYPFQGDMNHDETIFFHITKGFAYNLNLQTFQQSNINLYNKSGHIEIINCAYGDPYTYIKAHPKENKFVTSSQKGIIALWSFDDKLTYKCINTLPNKHQRKVTCITFNHDGTIVLTGFKDGIIHLYNTHDATHKETLIGHTKKINSLHCSPNGQYVVSGSNDCTARIWKLNSQRLHPQRLHSQNPCIMTIPNTSYCKVLNTRFLNNQQVVIYKGNGPLYPKKEDIKLIEQEKQSLTYKNISNPKSERFDFLQTTQPMFVIIANLTNKHV